MSGILSKVREAVERRLPRTVKGNDWTMKATGYTDEEWEQFGRRLCVLLGIDPDDDGDASKPKGARK